MARAGQGVILLGYARSAGSGDQPIAGTVTSRRDRGQQQRQKLLKQQQLEEERLVRQRQELAAQFLKKKWREQDTKRKDDVSTVRYDSESEEGERRRRSRSPKRPVEEESRETNQRSEGPSLQEGKWVSVGGGAPCQQREAATGSKAIEAPKQIAISAKPPAAMPDNDPRQKQRKKALANAFRVDEEDVEARRELELAAKLKKARVEAREARVTEQAVVDTRPAVAPAAAPPAPKPMDMYEQMKKLAEWKRSCKGNRRPMPDDMVKAIAESSGLAAPELQASTTSSASSSRRRSRSRSRSRSGNRRFNESLSRRPERGRSERDATRSRRSGRQSRSTSRGSRAATRCVL